MCTKQEQQAVVAKLLPLQPKTAGQVSYSIATFFFIFASGCLLGFTSLVSELSF
jgi:Na+-driven multidrug efflux pump